MDRPNWYPKGTLAEPYEPQEVDDVTLVFPANVSHLMPPVEVIPEEFGSANFDHKAKRGPDLWLRFQSTWFYEGLSGKSSVTPVEGVDPEKAFRHLSAIQGSFEPKHEYKAAAVAYLASLWFKGWKP